MGRFRNAETGTIRKMNVKNGRNTVNVVIEKSDVTCTISKLVLTVFKSPPKDNEHSRHVNGDRMDDRLENLEWTTESSRTVFAERVKSTPVKVTYANGDEMMFDSAHDAAVHIGVTRDTVYRNTGKGEINGITIEKAPVTPRPGAEIKELQFGDKKAYTFVSVCICYPLVSILFLVSPSASTYRYIKYVYIKNIVYE